MPAQKGVDSKTVADYVKAHPELSYDEVGKQFGIGGGTVGYHFQKFGGSRNQHREEKPGMRKLDGVEIVRLRREGASYKEIAERTGARHGSIGYYLKKAGLSGTVEAPHKVAVGNKKRVNGHIVDVLTGSETLRDRVLDAAWNAMTVSEKAALIFGACREQ